jgi:hypothetical integral membrane protein (TIGR02206 family)
MTEHETVEIFSSLWWNGLLITFALIGTFLYLARQLNSHFRKFIELFLGLCFLSGALLVHPYLFYLGKWSLQTSLPLHMCTICAAISGWVLINPKQWSFEVLCYWGIPGGLHSLLTPEFVHGTEGLLIPEYYFLHGNILFVPLYLSLIQGMRLGRSSWFIMFLWTQLVIPIIGGINWLLKSNYMYLAKKPVADNPFIIGEWPWYVLVLEAGILFHFLLVYFFFRQRRVFINQLDSPNKNYV